MLYMENEVKREKATRLDEMPQGVPAGGGMPGFGEVLGRGLAVGTLGGIACNFVLMVGVGVFLFFSNLAYGLSLSTFLEAAIGAGLGLVIGSIVAAPIGLAIGALSATLMWQVLNGLPRRDEHTRRVVGMICAGFVALLATVIAASLLADPFRAGWYTTLTQPMMWVFIPEAIVVTFTGGWFAKRYL